MLNATIDEGILMQLNYCTDLVLAGAKDRTGSTSPSIYFSGLNFNDMPLTQCLSSVGVGNPSPCTHRRFSC